MKSVCGLDVHKDSVYLCILSEFGELIEKVFGVLTYELEEMRDLMLHHHVVEVSLKSATKPFNVLLACARPLITELSDKLRLKHPLLPTNPLTPQCDLRQYAVSYL